MLFPSLPKAEMMPLSFSVIVIIVTRTIIASIDTQLHRVILQQGCFYYVLSFALPTTVVSGFERLKKPTIHYIDTMGIGELDGDLPPPKYFVT